MSMLHQGKSQASLNPSAIMNRTYSSSNVPKYHLNNIPSAASLSHLGTTNTHTNSSLNVTLSPSIKKELNLANQRLDLGVLIEELTSILGKENWVKYAQSISYFMLGKLSRVELVKQLDILFEHNITDTTINNDNENATTTKNGTDPSYSPEQQHRLIRLHNQLLLGIFANSLRNSPLGQSDRSWGFQNGNSILGKNVKRVNKHNSQIETYKKIVMSLPNHDRNRLKMITRESGKRGFIYCTVLQNRLYNVPKIPIVTNQDTLKRVKKNNLKTPLEWSQDIVNGFNAPLAVDTYSLPDNDSLFLRMTGISREHGLVGTVDARCVDMLSLALDNYLKSLVEIAIDSVRYRRKKYSEYYDLNEEGVYVPVSGLGDDFLPIEVIPNHEDEKSTQPTQPKISLTNEDIQNALTIFPNLVEPASGSIQTLTTTGLYNDDDLVVMKSSIDDMPQFKKDRPLSTPLDERNIGTREELNWLIKDILTEE